jgi:hypothetical protein
MKLTTKKGTKLFLITVADYEILDENGKVVETRKKILGWKEAWLYNLMFWIKFQYRKYFED